MYVKRGVYFVIGYIFIFGILFESIATTIQENPITEIPETPKTVKPAVTTSTNNAKPENQTTVKPVLTASTNNAKPENQTTVKPENQTTVKPTVTTSANTAKTENHTTVKPENQTTVKPAVTTSTNNAKPENQTTVKPTIIPSTAFSFSTKTTSKAQPVTTRTSTTPKITMPSWWKHLTGHTKNDTIETTVTSTMLPTWHTTGPIIVTNTTLLNTTVIQDNNSDAAKSPVSTGLALGIFLAVAFLVIIGGIALVYAKKKRKFSYNPCTLTSCTTCVKVPRKRRTSSGSHGPLTTDDTASITTVDIRHERELFSIGDQDGGEDGRPSSSLRERRGTEDDYFYDEIFERSAFVDATTNRSNKNLTINRGGDDNDDSEDELDIPDLVFKKATNSRI